MKKIILLLLIIIWMGVIFFFSGCDGEASSSQSFGLINSTITKIIDIFDKDIDEAEKIELIEKINPIVRKIAHMGEYFILCILVSLFIGCYNVKLNKLLLLSLIICFLYACSDEIHQLFIEGRSGQFSDVLIDSIGSCIWIVIYYFYKKCKKINLLLNKNR